MNMDGRSVDKDLRSTKYIMTTEHTSLRAEAPVGCLQSLHKARCAYDGEFQANKKQRLNSGDGEGQKNTMMRRVYYDNIQS